MRQRRGPELGAIILGIILVIVGTAFLLSNAGVLDLDWSLVWPIILIAVGAVVVVGASRGYRGGTGEQRVVVPVDGARRLELTLRVGAGTYVLGGGAATGLVEATADDETISSEVRRAGEVARVRLSTAVDGWGWGWRRGHTWQIAVSPSVPVQLDMRAGAGSFRLDLSSVAVMSAAFTVGAGELSVVLPRPRGNVPIRVEGGAASLTFHVPPGIEARVTTSGLVSATGPRETPGYASATDRVTVAVTGGIASVRVVQAG